MPYTAKGKCIYKKDTGAKVGCTKGSVKKYLAALHANADESIVKEWGSDSEGPVFSFDAYIDNGVSKLARNTDMHGVIIPKGTPISQIDHVYKQLVSRQQIKEIIKKTIQDVLKEQGLL